MISFSKLMALGPVSLAFFGSANAVVAQGTAPFMPGCVSSANQVCSLPGANLGSRNATGNAGQLASDSTTLLLAVGSSVYINQVGTANVASVIQASPDSFVAIGQSGSANISHAVQSGLGVSYLTSSQIGLLNNAQIFQTGLGPNHLDLRQLGFSNSAWSVQNATGYMLNDAQMSQTGNNNGMKLSQNGSDNIAVLQQRGNDNSMTAVQAGDGNRLMWSQEGNHLPDIQISQSDGSANAGQLVITQTGY